MRSDKSSINQLLMCMSKPETGEHPGPYPTMKVEPSVLLSSETSRTSYDDNDVIAFGPIKVKPRKRPAPTLATGRRSKYENLPPEEAVKRDVRRKRNREAAERVRLNRLAVEEQLMQQITALERNNEVLQSNVQHLENDKLRLEARLQMHRQHCPTFPFSSLDQPAMITTNLFLDGVNSVGSMQNFDGDMDFDLSEHDLESILNGESGVAEVTDDFFTGLFSVN